MPSPPPNRLGIVVLTLLIAAGQAAAIAQQSAQAADNAGPDIADLQRALAGEPSADEVRALIPDLLAAAARDEDAGAALPLIERVIESLKADPRDDGDLSALTLLMQTAARLRFDQLDPPGAEAHLQTLLELHRRAKDRADEGSDPLAWPRQLVAVARDYLRGGSLEPALGVLGELADLNLPDERLISGHEQVSAALNRRLEALSTDARYELLYRWVMPGGGRTNIRCWSSITPVEAPPSVFARALGERPSDNAFPIPQVNGLTGLFSIEWQLIDAARQSGRLRRLTTELERMARDDVPDAEYVLLLARIAGGGQPLPADELSRRLASASLASGNQSRPPTSPPPAGRQVQLDRVTAWTVIAAVGMSDPSLLQTSQAIFEQVAALPAVGPGAALRPFYQRAALDAAVRRFSASGKWLDDPALQHWVPAQVDQRPPGVFTETRSVWGQNEGHLFRLSGPGDDWLCFRYPLEGDFEFEVDALDGGTSRLLSRLMFDAQTFTPNGSTSSTQIGRLGRTDTALRPSPFIRRETWPAYQRLKVQVVDSVMTLSINGHPILSQPRPDRAAPWLALSAPGHPWTIFRNVKLTGASIPREVPLSDGTRLSGWYWQREPSPPGGMPARSMPSAPQPMAKVQTSPVQPSPAQPGIGTRILRGLFGGSAADEAPQPTAAEAPQKVAVGDTGSLPTIMTRPASPPQPWRVSEGEIHGDADGFRQHGPANRLTYFRPLQSGESVRYEFYYEPGSFHVHPALGRLSFRIDPSGIRVRWLTDSENGWTGLPLNHEVAEPFSRRGPRSLPLVAGDWNRLSLSLDGDTVMLELNEAQVYVRKLEPEVGRSFSLCTDEGSAARVRSVVLSGDWPLRLDSDPADTLVAHRETPSEQHLRALDAMLSGRHVADAALDVHRRAAAMSPEDRYEYLASWVLPGPSHADLRLALDFTPTDPPPPVMRLDALDRQRLELAEQEGTVAVLVGGNLISPALDLIDTAGSLGKLDEIRRRVERAAADDPGQLRSRLAMLSIIDIARQDFAAAGEHLVALFAEVEAGEHTEFVDRWPETLAVHAALAQTQTRGVGRDLAFHLFFNQARDGRPSGSEAWRRHVIAMAGLAQWFGFRDDPDSPAEFTAAPPLQQWRAVSMGNSKSLGLGYPKAHWEVLDDGPINLASHGTDFLFFQSPLEGDYEVQAEVPAFGWRDTHIVAGGIFVGLAYTKSDYDFGNLSGTVSRLKFDPPMRNVGQTLRYRIVVRDGVQTTGVDGRVLHRQPLDAEHPPWTAIHAPRQLAAAKQLRIAGQPQIPEHVRLSAPSDLAAWASYHDDPSLNYGGPLWRRVASDDRGAEIVGSHFPELAGTYTESLLRYCRPMWEDGTIVYEFYYDDSGVDCHPALGRLAFILHPSGVREHWITDGAYDRSGLDPANESAVDEHRRGPERLPLEPGQWNRVELTLLGDAVLLKLNGRQIYQRPLEITNQRQFGLFHFADQGEARVRGVVWRGDWPRRLPPLDQQELADDEVSALDASPAELPNVFSHDFASEGFPEERFLIVHGEHPHHIDPGPQGLAMRRTGADGYRNATISPRLAIEGDFDVTVTYEDLDTQAATPGSASLMLIAKFDDAAAQQCTVQRRQMINDAGFEEQVYQTVLLREQDGQVRRNYSRKVPLESAGGRLRLSRRGEIVHYLIAEDDSPLFQLIRSEPVGSEPLLTDGLYVMAQTHMAGSISVIVKSIEVRAASLVSSLQQGETTVRQLDEQRERLSDHFVHDFSSDPFTGTRFHHWAFAPDPAPQPTGQRVLGVAADDWRSAGAAPKLSVRGDFDIRFDFDILRADPPLQGDSSSVYLQIEFPGDDQVQASALAQISSTGVRLANSQVRLPDGNRGHEYRSLRQQQADPIVRLRLARRSDRLYWLYATKRSGPDQLLTEFKVSTQPIESQNIRLMVHTGGEARIMETLWKKLAIRAEELVFFD